MVIFYRFAGYPAGYRILKKSGLSGRISGGSDIRYVHPYLEPLGARCAHFYTFITTRINICFC
jgi:hypothetical protein